MKTLDKYNESLQELYDYFGFVEDYVVYPIDDRREYYWMLGEGFFSDNSVLFADKFEHLYPEPTGDHYSNSIYTQRFYQKHIYKGKDYTMIFVDTHTDGNKFFAIFDNSKKITKHLRKEKLNNII